MIFPNMLVEFEDKKKSFVICHVSQYRGLCAITPYSNFLDNSNKKFKKPKVYQITHIQNLMKGSSRVRRFEASPMHSFSDEHLESIGHLQWIQKRDANLAKYQKFLTEDVVDQYLYGGGIAELVATELEINPNINSSGSIYNALNKSVSHSCAKNAFLTFAYAKCGSNSVVEAKRGRKNKYGTVSPGVTEANKKNIKKATLKHCRSNEKFSISTIAREYQDEYEVHHVTNAFGSAVKVAFAPEERLSESQLRYHINRSMSFEQKLIAQHGNNAYLKDHKPKTGVAHDGLVGATARYEIDATVLDVYIVDPLGRSSYTCGRAVLTLIVDTYSTMIMGLHVGMSSPNWETTALALINAFSDKVEFAEQFGLELCEDDWPAHHFCDQVTGDNGKELKQDLLSSLLNSQIGVETFNFTPAFRGDLKGVVESKFKVLNDQLIHSLPGSIFKKTPRDEQHPANRAELSIHDLYREIIKSIIEYNKSADRSRLAHMNDYDCKADTSPQGIFLSSLERDMLGEKDARVMKKEDLYWALLPEEFATVRQDGIFFKGVKFISNTKNLMPLLLKAKEHGLFKIPIKKTRNSFKSIWYKTDAGEIIALENSQSSFAFQLPDASWELIDHAKEIIAERKKTQQQSKLEIRVDLDQKDQTLAVSSKSKEKRTSSRKSMPTGINDRKQEVINDETQEYANTLETVFVSNKQQSIPMDIDENDDSAFQNFEIDTLFDEE